ncbi:glycosyltransferase family 4 protein [Steroidobacter sp.]|uniref:glycosyltransferase family 4 protein n=1 Tax=Steroidobacter sp. TaxID=1978227 RepID=UPI001A422B79|nr:glycosyltransferase family 4 protein [Steroidobacter sp.]MBL8267297.1 glycosyltransferase family 4 protein [Steroidobacter sp.]
MIKVLVLFSAAGLGGAERSLTRMCLANAANDITYRLGTVDGEGEWTRWVRTQGIEPLVVSLAVNSRVLGNVWGLRRRLRDWSPDLVYAVGLRASIVVRLLKPTLPGLKVVHAIRTSFPPGSELASRYGRSERLLRGLTAAFIANSIAGADSLARIAGVKRASVRVIPNGIEVPPMPSQPVRERAKVVAVIANLHPLKGHLPFLEVIAAVIRKHPDVKFLFVGRDDLNGAIQQAVLQQGLATNIRFEGFQADIAPFLAAARMLVLPSRVTEGAPTAILEAQAAALPTIAYAVGGVQELIRRDVDGYVEQVDDVDGMAGAIVALLDDPIKAEQMGLAARRKVQEQYSLSACAERHATVWREICG